MKGILGINARNLLYIRPYNKKKAIRMADDKLKTKHFLSAREIPVPKLYAVIKDKEDVEKFDFSTLPNSFVLKPNCGFGGEGIIVITDKKENEWVTESGKKYTREDFREHIMDILDGRYSIANISDWAFFEQRIITHDILKPYGTEGLPDIRIVVHNLIPVMAMLRIPTKESEGKANLHMGGVGVGIDIAKGEATYITSKNKILNEVPGLGPIKGFKIPFWDEILLIASKIQLVTNLGYLAVDIAIDENGPILLEINARAGLSVQLANLAPLRKRLERIEGVKVTTPEKGVRIAKDMFGNIVEKQIKEVSGKTIIGPRETIELFIKNETFHVPALIDNRIERSLIDKKLAEKLKMLDEEKETIKLKFNLAKKRIQTVVGVSEFNQKDFKFIVGKRDLGPFLIDPSKKEAKISKTSAAKPKIINLIDIDKKLAAIDKKIKPIHYLKPLNLRREREKFFKNFSTNPQFIYPRFPYEFEKLRAQLKNIEIPACVLGELFEKKKQEMLLKLDLLENIGTERFTYLSEKLYGREEGLVEEALIKMKYRPQDNENENIRAEEAKKIFEERFREYGLTNWEVKLKTNMVADCSVSKNNVLFIKKNAKFSRMRIAKLIAHELETHILTAENGKYQPYEIFNGGTAGYLQTQEGLAVVIQNKALKIPDDKALFGADALLAVYTAKEKSFVEVFDKLLAMGVTRTRAFDLAVKVKRGLRDTSRPGGFTKETIYFKGAKRVLEFLEKGGDIKKLYIGKIALEDLAIIEKIPEIIPPKYLPKWL